jgi:C1A family cysteine protease
VAVGVVTRTQTRKIARYGWNPDLPDIRDQRYVAPTELLSSLPSSVDLRPLCPPVYDQGQLGSSTVNAVASAIQFERERLKPSSTSVPSRLFLYYNGRAIGGTVDIDSGVQIRDVIKVLAKEGAPSETQWPYDIAKFAQKPPARAFSDAVLDHSFGYYRLARDLDQMKCCLASGHPFVFGFTAYASFESQQVAQTGVVQLPSRQESMFSGHAAMAAGYDDGQQRFIARNSWGTGWGMSGYFTMPYAYLLESGLSSDFWTIRVT